MNEYLPFQVEGINIMARRKHNLLADDMGLGKTIQAIGLINRLKLRTVLIIVKASIKINWKRKLEEWLDTPRVIQIVNKKTDVVEELAEVVIVNYELVSHSYMFQQLCLREWDLLICDEAHALKSTDSKRTKAVLAKNGIAHHAKRSLMLTGTPILNRPVELYPILKTFAPQVMYPYNDYFRFAKRYCDAWQDGFSFNVKGASNTEELNKKLREHYMIRRLTHEVEVQLPKRSHEIIFIDSDESVISRLRVLDAASRRDFKHQTLDAGAGELATLRRETAEAKIDRGMDTIKEYVESTEKIVIFAYHRSVIDKLKTVLGEYGVVALTGSTSQQERDKSIQSFKNDPNIKVFLGQIQAAGEGIDGLQEVCHNVLFLEWSWVPGEIEQACKRVHRLGQTRPVFIRFLVWADSVEEHIMRVALDKVKVIREIMK